MKRTISLIVALVMVLAMLPAGLVASAENITYTYDFYKNIALGGSAGSNSNVNDFPWKYVSNSGNGMTSSGTSQSTKIASGNSTFASPDGTEWARFDLYAPAAGKYALKVKYVNYNSGGSADLYVREGLVGRIDTNPTLNGGTHGTYGEIELGQIVLAAGYNDFVLKFVGDSGALFYLSKIYLTEVDSLNIFATPTSLTTSVGKSVSAQLSAKFGSTVLDFADATSLTAVSEDDAIATVELSGATVTVTGVAAGETEITVSATFDGETVNTKIPVAISAAVEYTYNFYTNASVGNVIGGHADLNNYKWRYTANSGTENCLTSGTSQSLRLGRAGNFFASPDGTDWFKFDIEAPYSGTYNVSIKYVSHTTGGSATLFVNDELADFIETNTANGGGDSGYMQTYPLGEMTLNAGYNSFKLEMTAGTGPFFYLSRIVIAEGALLKASAEAESLSTFVHGTAETTISAEYDEAAVSFADATDKTATCADESIATAEISGDTVTVTGVANGETSVTVTGKINGLLATVTIPVVIENPDAPTYTYDFYANIALGSWYGAYTNKSGYRWKYAANSATSNTATYGTSQSTRIGGGQAKYALPDGSEWMEFDLMAPAAGTYDVKIKFVGYNTGGSANIIMNGTTLGRIDTNPAVGTTAHGTLGESTYSNVALLSGANRLRISFIGDSGYYFFLSKVSIAGFPTLTEDDVKITIPTVAYTGSASTPAPTITLLGQPLTSGTHFICSYSDNTAIGDATCQIDFMGEYAGTITKSFAIKAAAAELDKQSIVWEDGTPGEYKLIYTYPDGNASFELLYDAGSNTYRGAFAKSFSIEQIKSCIVKSEGAPKPLKYGVLSANDSVSVLEAIIAQRIYNNGGAMDDATQLISGDVNADGAIDVQDSLEIINNYVFGTDYSVNQQ